MSDTTPAPKDARKAKPQTKASVATAARTPISAARFERRTAELARRRGLVLWAKRSLPFVAVLLLATVIAWPEIQRDGAIARLKQNAPAVEPASGEMSNGRYNGVNENGEPFTVTAVTAHQTAPDRIDLGTPIGDITMRGGAWLQSKGQHGVFDQVTGQLDLQGDVSLYRDDGTKMDTDTATIDTKRGAASSADQVHVEGPFGTLDAQGFTLLDRGNVIQFTGPGRLVLQGASK